jgi:hypothetical protein
MPTDPAYEFVPRHLKEEEPEVFELLSRFSEVIDEAVNFGSRVFKWCNASLDGKADKEVPLILLFRHVLELLDAVSILIKESAAEPCKLQLRSIFEALLSINYLLEGKQDERAYAFLVCHAYKKIKTYKKLDPKTQQGKQFRGVLKGSILDDLDFGGRYDLKKMVEEKNKLFKKEGYKEAYQELERLRNVGRKNPNWYEFYDGPRDLEQLAIHLNKREYYEIFYRYWSEYVHGSDIISGNLGKNDEGTYLLSIRQPFEAQSIVSLSLTMVLEIYRVMINHYVPLQITHYRIWYVEKMQKHYKELSNSRRIIKKADGE